MFFGGKSSPWGKDRKLVHCLFPQIEKYVIINIVYKNTDEQNMIRKIRMQRFPQREWIHCKKTVQVVDKAEIRYEATPEQGGSADEMAKAAADIVRCRETTNQKLIAFYEKMADDCKPPQGQAKRDEEFLTTLMDYLSSPKSGVNESEAELFRNFIKNC